MKKKTSDIKPFYAIANRLLRARIKNIEDIKQFYTGVNDLASQMASNPVLITELSSPKYNDNRKLFKGITYILGYGQVIGSYKDLFTAKEVKLDVFLKKNPRIKSEIRIIQKEARIYFNTLANRVEELEKRVEDLKKEIKEIKDIKINSSAAEEISIGPLKYKNHSIFYGEKRLDLPPQLVRLCRLFMEKSQKQDTFVADDKLSEEAEASKRLSNKNMQKAISKLRRILKEENDRLYIKRVNKEGYIFKAGDI